MIAVTQTDIADAVAKKLDQSDMVINEIFTALIREMKRQLLQKNDIVLADFGRFTPLWYMSPPYVQFLTNHQFAIQLSKLEEEAD